MKGKIVFHIGNLARGGAQRVAVNLANYFHKEGCEVTLVTAKWEPGEYEYADGIQRILSDLTEEEQCGNRVLNFCRRQDKLRKIWKSVKPDIILAFMGKSNLNAIVTSRGLGIPVLVSVRSDPEREYGTRIMKLLSKTLFGMASGIVLQTEDAVRYFPRLLQEKAVIMPNSLDARFIRPLFTGERRKEIVSVGAVDENKNNRLLIEAFADIAAEYPGWSVTIYGEGCKRQELTRLAGELGLSGRISLPGREYATYDKIYDASVYVLTSNAEGMPNALMEAMALGLACISTDCPCGGPRTLIREGVNGLLIPVGDQQALSRALRRLIEDRALREALGREAHRLSEEAAPDKVNRMWQEYVESKIAGKGISRGIRRESGGQDRKSGKI